MNKNLNLHVGSRIDDWIVCSIRDHFITLFPLVNMNKGDWNTVNIYCSCFRNSPIPGWKVVLSKLPNVLDYVNIKSQTNKSGSYLAGSAFWLSDSGSDGDHYYVNTDGRISYDSNGFGARGARPFITLVRR